MHILMGTGYKLKGEFMESETKTGGQEDKNETQNIT